MSYLLKVEFKEHSSPVVTELLGERFTDVSGDAQGNNLFLVSGKSEPHLPGLSAILKSVWQGVLVKIDGAEVTIYSDPVGSVPVYYTSISSRNTVYISDSADQIFSILDKIELEMVAFWQSVAFETPLGNRTIIAGVYQLNGGQSLRFASDLDTTIQRYWDWNFRDEVIHNLSFQECIERASELLESSFNSQLKGCDGPYLLPISGGLDSRLVTVLASRNLPKDLVQPVTYAYSSRSQEYQLAKAVCSNLGLKEPIFHELNSTVYKDATEWMPRETGGMVAFFNCHLLDYLRKTDFRGTVLTSAFSDGLCGYESQDVQGESWENSAKVKQWIRFSKDYGLDEDISCTTMEDLEKLSWEWTRSSISSFDEFLYIVERHSKFHLPLINLWQRFSSTATPFISSELFELFFSMRPEFRINKSVEKDVVEYLCPGIADIGSMSSLVLTGRTGSRSKRLFHRSINFLNVLLRGLGYAEHEIPSSRITEQLAKALHTELRADFDAAINEMYSRGALSSFQLSKFSKPSLRFNEKLRSQLSILNAFRIFE